MKTEKEVIYPDLSYKIVGSAFAVFNSVGFGMSEKFYQKLFAQELEKNGLQFKKESMVKINYGAVISRYFLDFVVDDKIVVELKVRPRLGYVHIKQVMEYLKVTGYRLSILIYFTKDGVKYRRILNAE